MNAYVRRIDAGYDHDPMLLEAIVLSAMPDHMRMDPAVLSKTEVNGGAAGQQASYGQATISALRLAVLGQGKGQGKGQGQGIEEVLIPKLRLAHLVSMLAVPGRNDMLPALRELVDQKKEPLVRHASLTAHTAIGTPEAAKGLDAISAGFVQSQIMQRQVMEAISSMPSGGESTVAGLLSNKNETLRARAAGVLMKRALAGGTDAEAKAVKLLQGSGSMEARVALLALGKAPEGTREQIVQHMGSLHSALEMARLLTLLGETASEPTVPLLCDATRNQDVGVATTAVQMLQHAGIPSSGPCLVGAAAGADERISTAALRALVDVPAGDATDRLCEIVEKLHAGGSSTAAMLGAGALGRAGGERAEELLGKLLDSSDRRVGRAAAVALFHLGHDEPLPLIMETIEDVQGPWDMQDFHEWRLLASNPTERTLPLLTKAVGDGNPSLRDKVVDGLTDGAHEEAIFLVEIVQLRRMGVASLEFRSPAEGKLPQLVGEVIKRLEHEGQGEGRRALVTRLLDGKDVFLVAVGLRLLEPRDGRWAVDRAFGVLRNGADPWLRIEAARTLAVLLASPWKE